MGRIKKQHSAHIFNIKYIYNILIVYMYYFYTLQTPIKLDSGMIVALTIGHNQF